MVNLGNIYKYGDISCRENIIFPEVPMSEDDWYVTTIVGDRLDLLSQKFYGTVNYWWVIARANSLDVSGFMLEDGIEIRIPANVLNYINSIQSLNSK